MLRQFQVEIMTEEVDCVFKSNLSSFSEPDASVNTCLACFVDPSLPEVR